MKASKARAERKARLLALYETGISVTEAAKQMSMSYTAALAIIQIAGALRHPEGWPPERQARLCELRAEGKSWAQIGVELDCNPEKARSLFKARGLDDKPRPQPHRVIGHMHESRAVIARRVEAEVRALGAVVMLTHRGRIVTAIPGTRVALAAERDRAVVNTYADATPGFCADWIAEDLAEVMP
jgi:hypothetical protein